MDTDNYLKLTYLFIFIPTLVVNVFRISIISIINCVA